MSEMILAKGVVLPVLATVKELVTFETSISISIQNQTTSHTLRLENQYCNGDCISPPEPTIKPSNKFSPAKFEGMFKKRGTVGMLCYQVEGSVGPTNTPYYLLIGWKVKRMAANQFCIRVFESDEPPLQGNKQQKAEFCKSIIKKHKQSTDQLIRWPACNVNIGNRFRVHATMSSV
ncbi:6809_t:CDS:2 [Funneliformis mosseae]|uniref:6809_t:CDS:1 n=1 Tax=Funneliformis mosseae TaxID=27381 RepID=A0A9N9DEV3_FUNMO|nr:6809_t:CDS:2 [Funneliformis mosseae]